MIRKICLYCYDDFIFLYDYDYDYYDNIFYMIIIMFVPKTG